ncbi:hypothetical protein [Streptomyces sp. NPDC049585]|uniref:hypothetical protein n=1 Tax=Streptomyces sp. NPDC049585 TaxID=3155154 RepID=UPI0034288401
MPVFGDRPWWGIWWPWMLLWLVTAVSAVALVILTIAARRRGRRPSERLVTDRTCLYLDNRTIMDQAQMNRYAVALRKEVEQRTMRSWAAKLAVQILPFLSPDSGVEASNEVVTKYIEKAEAISAIGVIVDGLERSNAIVHADLRRGTVRRNAALAKAYAGRFPEGPVPLSCTEKLFVLLTGDFRKDDAAPAENRTVLLADYGRPPHTARVRVSCNSRGLRGELDSDRFSALCLGKVQNWKAEEGVLEVRPLAIFS